MPAAESRSELMMHLSGDPAKPDLESCFAVKLSLVVRLSRFRVVQAITGLQAPLVAAILLGSRRLSCRAFEKTCARLRARHLNPEGRRYSSKPNSRLRSPPVLGTPHAERQTSHDQSMSFYRRRVWLATASCRVLRFDVL